MSEFTGYGLFSLYSLRKVVEKTRPVVQFIGNMLTKGQEAVKHNTEYITWDEIEEKAIVAKPQSAKLKGEIVKREKIKARAIIPPYFKPTRETNACYELKRKAGENTFGNQESPKTRALRTIQKDILILKQSILRAIERMFIEAIMTGKIEINGSGTEDTIDFEKPAGNHAVLTGADLWTAGTADIIANINNWSTLARKATGKEARICILGEEAANAFLAHDEVQKYMDKYRIEPGRIYTEGLPSGVADLGLFNGVKHYRYADFVFDEATQTDIPLFPTDQIAIFSENMPAMLHFGAIKHLEMGVVGGTDFFVHSWKNDDPSAQYVQVHSAPCPILPDLRGVQTRKVV